MALRSPHLFTEFHKFAKKSVTGGGVTESLHK